jgi:hypothetical protein
MTKKIAYGPNHDGLLDPKRITPRERAYASEERLLEERARRRSPSPVIRKLQAATDTAFRTAR